MTESTQPAFSACLAKTLRCSRFAARLLAANPALETTLRDGFALTYRREDMLARLDSPTDAAALMRDLRRLRNDVMLRLMLRDLNGLAALDEVVTTVSELAEVAIEAALAFHSAELVALHGEPKADSAAQRLLVVGMGKLGGLELNVSSDIDLIFVYNEDGETDGDKVLSNHEFFARLGKKIIQALDERTEDGFVFRVDMRLRPFGDSGPLVVCFASLEHYFLTSARPWERYAWQKARVLGAPAPELEALVRPFVYRKYLDYGMIQDLRDLHAQIRAEASRRNRLDDIKVGNGGIREIEFVAQLQQLIRGGRESALQTRSTRKALARLAERGLLAADSVTELHAAYDFLRRLEHRLQYLDDAQTQALPAVDADRAIIADAMNFTDWSQLIGALDHHRATVSSQFSDLFAIEVPESAADATRFAWRDSVDQPDALIRQMAELGYTEVASAELVQRLAQWRQSARYRFLTEKAQRKLDRLIPYSIEAASHEAPSASVCLRLFDILESIDRRDAYLSLLVENPGVLRHVARLSAKSAWAAELLQRHPILLDELLRAGADDPRPDWTRERGWLEDEIRAAGDDVEKHYDLLRHFKQVHTLRLNIADIDGALSIMALADELSALADLLLDVALQLAWRAINGHRELVRPQGFAIIGYGKLGSKELGYASDLDLVFLRDENGPINAGTAQRLAQRLNQLLTAMTAGGVLYETDLRLRPDGDSGMMVSTLAAFRDYQLERAWTWEHQALTRGRFCVGDVGMAKRFEAIRGVIVGMPANRAKLMQEVLGMRAKMRAEFPARADAEGRVDLKHVAGGIIDLEFIVQFVVLANAQRHASLTRNAGNFTLLNLAGELGLIDRAQAKAAANAYLAFRARQHLSRNNNEPHTMIGVDELTAERAVASNLWEQVFGKGA